MKRSSSPNFVLELPLHVSAEERRVLQARLELGKQVYNACLGETMRRLKLKRESKAYQAARLLPKGAKRQEAFAKINETFGFSEFALHDFVKHLCTGWMREHLDRLTQQSLASRAFNTVQQHAFGKRGKPRFKRQIHSVEGKNNTSGIRWREGNVFWFGLELAAVINEKDPLVQHGLQQRIKYVRLVRRNLNGKILFYVQLILEGRPYQKKNKNPIGYGRVGLDLGPSTLAAVGERNAFLVPFCAELDPQQAEIRRLQRHLDRQRRDNNPQNYAENNMIKKGKLTWHVSRRMQRTRQALADLQRRKKAQRLSLQGQLVNQVFRLGDVVQLEKISYKAWQKMFGRSITRRAPGLFVSLLKRKAASAGAQVHELPTHQLKLSQTCHACGKVQKKPLSQRWHDCDCGISAQRDLYSAFLAQQVQDNQLNADSARRAWSGVEALLRTALSGSFQQENLRKKGSSPRSVARVAPEQVVRVAD